jgi:hypothetical protein
MSLEGSDRCIMMTTTNKSDKEWLAEFVAELRRKKLDQVADVLVEEIKKEHLEQEE